MNLVINIARSIAQRSSLRSLLAFLHFIAVITVFAQPANDNPCNAIALPVNGACVNTAGTVQNATASTIAAPSCGSGDADVWYTAVVPASGSLTVTLRKLTLPVLDTVKR